MKSLNKRIFEFDVLRVIAMLFIITYHFGVEYNNVNLNVFNFLCLTPNFDFGNIGVTIFFVLSGALLYDKYGLSQSFSIKPFYLKRFKSIYPPFWILNIYIILSMIRHGIADGNPFFAGNPLKLLLTFFGLDGYLTALGFENYYFCGEWFIAPIVFLYLIFPLLICLYKKNSVLFMTLLSLLYFSQFFIPLPASIKSSISLLPFTFILKFCIGFWIMDHMDFLKNRVLTFASLILFFVLCFIKMPNYFAVDFYGSIASIALFITLYSISSLLLHSHSFKESILRLSPICYCIFLLQHICIVWSQKAFIILGDKFDIVFGKWQSLLLLMITIFLTFISAWVLNKISSFVVLKVQKRLSNS